MRESVRSVREDEARRQENICATSQSRNVSVISTYYFSFQCEQTGQQGKLLFTGCLKTITSVTTRFCVQKCLCFYMLGVFIINVGL